MITSGPAAEGAPATVASRRAGDECCDSGGLKEAKDLADQAPSVIREKVSKEEAEAIKAQLVEAGATVEIR